MVRWLIRDWISLLVQVVRRLVFVCGTFSMCGRVRLDRARREKRRLRSVLELRGTHRAKFPVARRRGRAAWKPSFARNIAIRAESARRDVRTHPHHPAASAVQVAAH